MAKCKGIDENGEVCGRPAMYNSDYCKNHRTQDPTVSICMGKNPAGKPCSRMALEGLLFCRQHRTQIADIEKLQCPRGCGLLSYRWVDNKGGYYVCKECRGAVLDSKAKETRLSKHVEGLNELLESGEECSLKCPNCEGVMLEFRVAYVIERGGGGGMHLGGGGGGGAIIAGIVVLAIVAAAAEASKRKSKGEYEQNIGETMVVDGCRECGTFWFDGDELGIARNSLIEGASVAHVARIQANIAEKKASKERIRSAAGTENCMHVEKRGMPPALKKCRRVTYRGTEYCYMHQPE